MVGALNIILAKSHFTFHRKMLFASLDFVEWLSKTIWKANTLILWKRNPFPVIDYWISSAAAIFHAFMLCRIMLGLSQLAHLQIQFDRYGRTFLFRVPRLSNFVVYLHYHIEKGLLCNATSKKLWLVMTHLLALYRV